MTYSLSIYLFDIRSNGTIDLLHSLTLITNRFEWHIIILINSHKSNQNTKQWTKSKNNNQSFETENGIFAQEDAMVSKRDENGGGTAGKGYYQYIGDDDKVYRVEYEVGPQGFIPWVRCLTNLMKFNSLVSIKRKIY